MKIIHQPDDDSPSAPSVGGEKAGASGAVDSRYLCHIERRCVSIAFFQFIRMKERCEWKRRTHQAVAPNSFLASTAATDGVENFVGKRPQPRKENQAGLQDRPDCKGKR